ncbi:hypothetical protein [Clostridium sp. LCP25S3_F8]|uniref:hypothetical protein n=1 Tax=Clostridium sp. LCP25S3_F8 TaxID=3438751 RepID=UPI003F8E3372
MINNLSVIDCQDLENINGGSLSLTIAGVTFVGWKAGALIAAGVTTLAGTAALGFYHGYKGN